MVDAPPPHPRTRTPLPRLPRLIPSWRLLAMPRRCATTTVAALASSLRSISIRQITYVGRAYAPTCLRRAVWCVHLPSTHQLPASQPASHASHSATDCHLLAPCTPSHTQPCAACRHTFKASFATTNITTTMAGAPAQRGALISHPLSVAAWHQGPQAARGTSSPGPAD